MTKAPDYQWGPPQDRTGKRYTAVFAIEDLLGHGEIDGFAHESFQGGPRSHLQYFNINRGGGRYDTPTAVHATDYLDQNGGLPFGIERKLILEDLVAEFLILCGELDYYYRIPIDAWKQIDPDPDSESRYTSDIKADHTICVTERSIEEFKCDLNSELNRP